MTLTPSGPPCVPIWLAVVVALAGAVVGGIFGFAAGMWLYPGPELTETGELHFSELRTTVGMVLGAGSGVAVAVGWSLLMRRLSVRASGLKIVAAGTGLGLAAGVVSTVILHAGLATVAGRWTVPDLLVGLFAGLLGAPAGLVTGLVCGIIAWAATAIARQRRARAAAAAAPDTPPAEDRP